MCHCYIPQRMTRRSSRLLLIVLSLTLLWTSSAWAWRVDSLANPGQPQQLQTLQNQDQGRNDACVDLCGHSCHSFAHFISLLTGVSEPVIADRHAHRFIYLSRLNSAIFPPPQRPPQA
jgi:hypothetical protein